MKIKSVNSKISKKQCVVSCQLSVANRARALRERGFSLIEAIIYSGLLALVVSFVIYFTLNIFNAYNKAIAQSEVMANIQFAMDTIMEELRFAKNIYTPTSAFNQNNGQLSVETRQNPPFGETAGFVDFYLDNGRIYMKREGQTEIPITSNQTKINKLRFTYLNPANSPEGAQIFVEGQFNTTNANLANQTTMDLTTSAIIRYK